MDSFWKNNTLSEAMQYHRNTRMGGWKGNLLYSQYPRKTDDIEVSSWKWKMTGWIKKSKQKDCCGNARSSSTNEILQIYGDETAKKEDMSHLRSET